MAKRHYKIILTVFFSILFFTTCGTLEKYDIAGIYKMKPLGESFSYTEIMQIHKDGTFSITSIDANKSFLDYIILCDTTKGVWQKCENFIILTTDCISTDVNDNILQLSPIEFSDSIKLKIVNFSDNSPVDMEFAYFDDTNNNFLFEKKTNEDGMVILPNKKIPFFSNHIGDGYHLTLEAGYYYQITYFDCFPIETYVQDTFLVKKDKLVNETDRHSIWQKLE